MRKWMIWFLSAVMLISVFLPMTVTASAATIQQDKDASLTLVYQYDGEAFQGLQIKTYRVADVTDDFAFALTGDFKDYPVKLYGITSQTEWNTICQTLQSYILADAIAYTAVGTTDEDGKVKFEELTPGMYLTMPVTYLGESKTTEFQGFLTVIPNPEEDGSLNYDVTAYPKCSQYVPDGDDRQMKVIKQWKDSGFEEYRPKSVKADIYRDGVFKTTVTLSAENNWCYSWTAANDGAVWTAVEREIPLEYTVTIEYKDDTIILTNVREDDPPTPPLGDSMILWPYILGMFVSGFLVIMLALSKKKAYQ